MSVRRIAMLSALLIVALLAAGCAQGAGSKNNNAAPPTDKGPASAPGQSGFQEYPLGDEVEREQMTIAGVYFQAVEMEPKSRSGLSPAEADIHLEADIHAAKNNELGFGAGEWVPFLTVDYELTKLDSGEKAEGSMMPMSASDGPHYGVNVKAFGAGKYRAKFIISSPDKQGYLIHTDKETGVPGSFWKQPIEVEWEFDFLPLK